MPCIRKVSSIVTGVVFFFQAASFPALAASTQANLSAQAFPSYPSAPSVPKDAAQQRCDQLAEAPADPDRVGAGVPIQQIKVSEALPVCEQATTRLAWRARYQFLYGRVLEAAQRYSDAATQYQLAAQGGQALAAFNLGSLYEMGHGVNQDWKQAAAWYQSAGDHGFPEGYGHTGMLYINSKPPNYAEGASWMEKAVKAGSPNAAYVLGWLYDTGNGVQKDPGMAMRLYTDSANRGVAEAMYRLGIIYKDGEGVQRDPVTAARWVFGAAKQGNSYAQEELGYMFSDGLGVTKDEHAALTWFLLAAQAGLVRSQKALAIMYDEGDVVARNPSEAVAWYRKAADQNDPFAMTRLGIHLRKGEGVAWNEAEAMRWFRKAADQGYALAESSLGYGLINGLGGGPQDYHQAAEWLTKAARQGEDHAQISLGWLYENGWGVDQDLQQARTLYLNGSRSSIPVVAEAGRTMAANLAVSSPGSSARPPDKSPDLLPAIALGVGIIAVVSLFSGSSTQNGASSGGGLLPHEPFDPTKGSGLMGQPCWPKGSFGCS
jgi:TPR repeat protein